MSAEIREKLIALMDEVDSIKENLDDADPSSIARDLESLANDLEGIEETVEVAQGDLRNLRDKLDSVLTEMDFSRPTPQKPPHISEIGELAHLVHEDRNRPEILASYMTTNPAKFWLAVTYNLSTNPFGNVELVKFMQTMGQYID
jgi:uncharacterized coiled-coil protein SlyX